MQHNNPASDSRGTAEHENSFRLSGRMQGYVQYF